MNSSSEEPAPIDDTVKDSVVSAQNILTDSENANNENIEIESKLKEVESNTTHEDETPVSLSDNGKQYEEHITYNEKGEAIYTDPATSYKYIWSNDENNWVPQNTVDGAADNPYENEHYRWCHETNKWIPKQQTQTTETENEFYKWDAEQNKWIPKANIENVTYGFEDNVHTYTDKDGVKFFWDETKKAWFPKIDDNFMAYYQMSYGFNTNEENSDSSEKATEGDETKIEGDSSNEQSTPATSVPVKRKAAEPKWFDLDPEHNTKVYVENLPDDITDEEFADLMSKCGMIIKDPITNKLKLKLYVDKNGQKKGDGLCDYIRIESVHLALNLLDGSEYRGRKIKVQRAKFEMRGEYNPALKPKKKKKEKEKLKKMQEKLLDWRPDKMRGERSKHERNVIIQNLFDPELFEKEVHLIIDYQKNLREECEKCGLVRKIIIYDRHPDGVAQIVMGDPEQADLVIQMMHGRYFGQRRLVAQTWDGKTKYKIDETEGETKERLSNWNEFLEKDEEGNAKPSLDLSEKS